ncbi:MAG: hypothetical protein WC735_04695 [Candidatus Paceibacterota bacterium]|jgi:hypothetical protein
MKKTKKKVEKVYKKIEYSPTVLQEIYNKEIVIVPNREQLLSLLKVKVPKLFDRDPQSYSNERLNNLADEIINFLK